MELELEIIIRLVVAALLGGIIGLEREMHGQPAGLRTHMIVAVGSALIMLVSLYINKIYSSADPGRIAAQVVTGIGFLGAGAILRFGMSVRGLTTAACIWAASGIGLAVGIGYYTGAVTATVIIFIATFAFGKVEQWLLIGRTMKRFVILSRETPQLTSHIEQTLNKHNIIIRQIGIHKDIVEHKAQVVITATCPDRTNFELLSGELSGIEGVEHIDIE